MTQPVSPVLLNLSGMPGHAGDPHLRPGNHLRVAHHPLLGLPVGPMVLQRANLDRLPEGFAPRRDAVFLDQDDQVLTLPIRLTKGRAVRALIPQTGTVTCIWVGIAVLPPAPEKPREKPRDDAPRQPMIAPISVTTALNRLPGSVAMLRDGPMIRLRDATAGGLLRPDPAAPLLDRDRLAALLGAREDADAKAEPASTGGPIRMRAYGGSIGGDPALLAERRAAPYAAAAPGIAQLTLTGDGTVTELSWLAAQDLDGFRWDTIDLLHLPRLSGMRYLSVTDAPARAADKVAAQAPRRTPLHEVPAPLSPASAPPFATIRERDRVRRLGDPLLADLGALIDGPQPPLQAAAQHPLTDATDRRLSDDPGDDSSVSLGHLAQVLQSTLDPGVAAWLGYKGMDGARQGVRGLDLYRVVAFFRHPRSLGAKDEDLRDSGLDFVLPNLPRGTADLDPDRVFNTLSKLAGYLLQAERRSLQGRLEPGGDYLMLEAVAAVDRGAPPLPPPPVEMLEPLHRAWMPAPPPAALREVECLLRGVLPGATLAFHRQQPLTGPVRLLNPRVAGSDWHRPMVLGLPGVDDGLIPADTPAHQGRIADRRADAGAARYSVAQQDRFGRWSEPASADAAPGKRPLPPVPVVQGSYVPPDRTDAAVSGGVLHLFVPLPEPDSLAPASHPLRHVTLHVSHHGVDDPTDSIDMPPVVVPVANAQDYGPPPPGSDPRPRALPAQIRGPVLAPTERRRAVIEAVWHDIGGQESPRSAPLRLAMTDPRPPLQMPVVDVLLYSARPDATGLAWIERRWTAPPRTHHAVFYTDEVRLVSWLAENGRQALAAQIQAEDDRAARAGLLRGVQHLFPDRLFERLADVIDDPAPGQRRFRHAVSGASRVLNAYRIATEDPDSGARPDLSALDMVFYGVPNSDPPPRPAVSVRMVPPGPGDRGAALVAEVTVTLEPGVTPPHRLRLHRTRGGPVDPLSAPLVAVQTLPASDPDQPRRSVVFRDIGTATIAPDARLSPYAGYRWFALAQGAPESGSSVPGMFSAPSDPAGLNAVPVSIDDAPTVTLTGTAVPGGRQGVMLEIDHRLGLAPTAMGRWRWQVLRSEPGQPATLLSEGAVVTLPLRIQETAPDGFAPLSTTYRVVLTDPLGRNAPPAEVTVG
ncbi:MAG: hypothetical protein ACK41Y_10140 [Paracoccus hibiscisoli]|uniref:hypothetical protein n=1 Tax=Paracoccus hibiscisoli TaxID=2023261 RepID=UPI0039192F20